MQRILKLTADVITPSILYIDNKSISTGKFPSVWKEAKVKPLFKTGNKEDVNNYGPISILPTLSKLIKKWVERQFSQYLNDLICYTILKVDFFLNIQPNPLLFGLSILGLKLLTKETW